MQRRITLTRRFAIATAIGMLIVLLLGARVTATGSGEGCGKDWPLCHGTWLPQDTYESVTEYTHRIVTGAEGILVAITSVLAWGVRKRYPEAKILVPVMAGTLIIQSLMGAAAVMWPQTPEVMAVHFGISMLCLAAASLLARVLNEPREDHEVERLRAVRAQAPDNRMRNFRNASIAAMTFSIIIAYTGAYVRHTGAELACTSWPTCNGELIPRFDGLHGIHTIHRIAALVMTLIIVWLFVAGIKIRAARPDLFRASVWAIALVLMQSIFGLLVVETGLENLLVTLLHAAGMSILFVIVCDCVRLTVWSQRQQEMLLTNSDRMGIAAAD